MAARRGSDDLGRYERQLRGQGFRLIAGADEAGRGALAGPLVAAAVVLPEDFGLDGLNDSKLLGRRQREEACARIRERALAVAVCRATPSRIDNRGLHRTNLWLLRRAIRRLDIAPDYVLTDGGWPIRGLDLPCLAIKKGDAVTASVAAASIVAKVSRDAMMDRYHRRFPAFGFDHNRGYGTPEHLEVLRRLGPTPIHRLSFRNVGQAGLFDPDGPATTGSTGSEDADRWDDGPEGEP
jgi:ribonuclease HII